MNRCQASPLIVLPYLAPHYSPLAARTVPPVLRSELVETKLLCVMASAFWPYLAAFRAEHDACERELLDIFLAGMHLAPGAVST